MLSFDRWLGHHREPVLGIDIGASGIYLVELAAPGWPLQLRHAAWEPLPRGALRDGAILMRDAVSDALRRAVLASGSRLRDAALALPAGAVMKKILSLPAPLHEEDLEADVDAEAGATLSFPREEIGIDFAVLGRTAGQEGFVDVMLVAARKEKIDERVEVAQAAGLRPRIVDIESHALMAAIRLAESVRSAGPALPVAILQVDAERGHCLFMSGGELLLERELGPWPPRRDADIAEQVCQEFDRLLQLYRASTTHAEPAHLYLLGTVAPELPDLLSVRTGLGITLPDPQRSLPDRHRLPPRSASCVLACGLALRSFDR